MPKISILIPLFNAENYVLETLDSVFNQSYKNIEVVVVDDGSTDNSFDLVNKIKSTKLKLFRQRNKGAASARNHAFQQSSGDFIKFLDADDILSENHLEIQLNKIANNTDCIASCEWGRFYGDNHLEAVFKPESVWKDMNSLDWMKASLKQSSDMMSSWLWLIPREVIQNAGLWDERLSLNDDFEFSVRLLLNSEEVRFAEGAKLYYRSGLGNSLSQSFSRNGAESALLTTKLGCDNILMELSDDEIKQVCANRYQTWVFRIYPKFTSILKKFEAEIERLGGSNIRMGGGRLFIFLRNIIGWKMAKRIQLFFYKIGWRVILKLKQNTKRLEQ